jgi:hypothetical protein
VATPFNRPTLSKAMADCQRYYQANGYVIIGSAANYQASVQLYGTIVLPVFMRAAPTFTILGTPQLQNCSALISTLLGQNQATFQALVTAANVQTYAQFGYQLSAEL